MQVALKNVFHNQRVYPRWAIIVPLVYLIMKADVCFVFMLLLVFYSCLLKIMCKQIFYVTVTLVWAYLIFEI